MGDVWVGFAIVQLLVMLLFSAWLVRYFSLEGMHIVYKVATCVAWLLGFSACLLLPIDIARSGDNVERSPALEGFWSFVYWSTFLLTWLILPLMQEYSAAGQFTFKGKFKESIKQNLIFYGAIGVCGLGFIIWIIIANNIGKDKLFPFMFTLATTFGLVNIVVMLGYGLVEVPRMVWRMSNPEAALRREHFKAPDLDQEVFDSVCAVAEIIAEVHSVKSRLPPSDSPEGLNLWRCYETVLARCEAVNRTFSESFRTQKLSDNPAVPPDEITEKYLARLHCRLKKESARCLRAQHRMNTCVKDCSIYEAMINKRAPPAPPGLYTSFIASARFTALWHWRLHYMSWINKIFAFLCAFMSLVILWCESVQPFKPSLSLLGGTLKGVDSFMWKHIVSLVSLLYLCWCTFLCIFRFKFFGLLELSGNRQTDAYSLLFNAAFMCRLQFAIAFNFIQITTLSSHTAFELSVGKNMQLFAGLNVYIPVIIGAFALLTLVNAFEWTLRLVGVEQKGAPRKGNAEDDEKIAEGRSLVARARQRTDSQNRQAAAVREPRNRDALNFDLNRISGSNPNSTATSPEPTDEGNTGGKAPILSGWLSKFGSKSNSAATTPSGTGTNTPASTGSGGVTGTGTGSGSRRFLGSFGSQPASADTDDDNVTSRSKLYNPPPAPIAPLKHTVFAPKQSLASFMSANKK